MSPRVIAPCAVHGPDALVVSCHACSVWLDYLEALREAEFWRTKYRQLQLRREHGRSHDSAG